MDTYEATRIVFSRIQKRDPENASRIMGLLLIQDHGEKEMIRLAFGPEALVQSVVLQARKELGLSCPSTPSSSSPFLSHNPFSLSRQTSTSSSISSRLGSSLPSPLSIPNPSSGSSSSWANSAFSEDIISPTLNNGTGSFPPVGPSSPSVNSFCPFYDCIGNEPMDEFQLQDHLSFLNDGSPTLAAQNQEILYPHRRSCSVSDLCLGAEDPTSGFVWKPCLYFARGYCKNGSSCKFLHGRLENSAAMVGGDGANFVGSPRNLEMVDQCQELLRSTSNQQQRLASASHLTASATFPYSASANKCLNFLLQQQQCDTQKRAAAALMTGDDLQKFGRARLDRNCFSFNGALDTNPGSRQIYLTFPADSTFREEDVSNYFSIYGPVQDVRIPYQQKRMFGFVTFVYPETVKLILAKGNPHFVCDARVLVKPYKEKGRVPDKYRKLQQVERGEFSTCNSPTGLSQRDPIDLQIGPRMFYNNPDMLWRRKLEEQVDLQQALEIQNRRLMGLQLDEKHRRHHHHRALSMGGFPLASPTYSSNFFDQSFVVPSNPSSPETPGEISSSDAKPSSPASATNLMPQQNVNGVVQNEGAEEKEKPNDEGSGKASSKCRDSDLSGSLEHNLPDSLFASPKKAAGECATVFTNGAGDDTEKNSKFAFSSASSPNDPLMTSTLLPASSTLDLASLKSCYFQVPRFPGHGAIGM